MAKIKNAESNKVLNGTSGNDSIDNNFFGFNALINAGAGNDSINNVGGSQVTIDGGKTLTGGEGADFFIYKTSIEGDYNYTPSNNIITDYAEEDTIRFINVIKKISTTSAGSVVFTFKAGDNKLVVKNAADKVVTYIDAEGSTATYGSLTVKGVTSLDGLSVDGKVITVSAASLGTEKISISDGYTLALGSDVSSSTTKKSWTFKNSTASYKQTTTTKLFTRKNLQRRRQRSRALKVWTG